MSDASTVVATSNAVSGAAGAYGTYQAGSFNAKVDEYNARIARLQTKDALARGALDVVDHRKQVSKLKGIQRATLAANGVVVDQDTAGDLLVDTDRQANEDEARIRHNAQLEAWGFRVQEVDSRARAQVERYTARNEATGQIMSTVGRFAQSTYRAKS